MSHDPSYRMRYRPDPIERLSHYEYLPLPMKGDPHAGEWESFEQRERAVYEAMMREKKARNRE